MRRHRRGRGQEVWGNPLTVQLVQMLFEIELKVETTLGQAEKAGLDEGDGGQVNTPDM